MRRKRSPDGRGNGGERRHQLMRDGAKNKSDSDLMEYRPFDQVLMMIASGTKLMNRDFMCGLE